MPKSSVARKQPLGEKKIKNKKLVERRQQQISEAALKLFSQKGYHNTTVRDIAIYQTLAPDPSMTTLVTKRISCSWSPRTSLTI